MNALFLSVYCYFKSMFNDEEGQDLIEYALIIAVFVIVAIIGLQLLGPQVTAIWTQDRRIPAAAPAPGNLSPEPSFTACAPSPSASS